MKRFFFLLLAAVAIGAKAAEPIDSLHFELNAADAQYHVTIGQDSTDFSGVAMTEDQRVRVLVTPQHTLTNITAYHETGALALSILFYDATDISVRYCNEAGERIDREEWMITYGGIIRRQIQKALPTQLVNKLDY